MLISVWSSPTDVMVTGLLKLVANPWLAKKLESWPSSLSALRLIALPAFALTTSGALPARTVIPSAGPEPLLVSCRLFPLTFPVGVVCAFTLFVLPRLNTAPMPVPANAEAEIMTMLDATAPTRAPFIRSLLLICTPFARGIPTVPCDRNTSCPDVGFIGDLVTWLQAGTTDIEGSASLCARTLSQRMRPALKGNGAIRAATPDASNRDENQHLVIGPPGAIWWSPSSLAASGRCCTWVLYSRAGRSRANWRVRWPPRSWVPLAA